MVHGCGCARGRKDLAGCAFPIVNNSPFSPAPSHNVHCAGWIWAFNETDIWSDNLPDYCASWVGGVTRVWYSVDVLMWLWLERCYRVVLTETRIAFLERCSQPIRPSAHHDFLLQVTRGLLDVHGAGVTGALELARRSISHFNNHSALPWSVQVPHFDWGDHSIVTLSETRNAPMMGSFLPPASPSAVPVSC